MEFLAPIHLFALQIRQNLEMGVGVREVLTQYCRAAEAPYTSQITRLLLGRLDVIGSTRMERMIFDILARGLAGEPILSRLSEIEEELQSLGKNAIEKHLQGLPILLLLPLLGLIFPAVILLLVGPIFLNLLSQLS